MNTGSKTDYVNGRDKHGTLGVGAAGARAAPILRLSKRPV